MKFIERSVSVMILLGVILSIRATNGFADHASSEDETSSRDSVPRESSLSGRGLALKVIPLKGKDKTALTNRERKLIAEMESRIETHSKYVSLLTSVGLSPEEVVQRLNLSHNGAQDPTWDAIAWTRMDLNVTDEYIDKLTELQKADPKDKVFYKLLYAQFWESDPPDLKNRKWKDFQEYSKAQKKWTKLRSLKQKQKAEEKPEPPAEKPKPTVTEHVEEKPVVEEPVKEKPLVKKEEEIPKSPLDSRCLHASNFDFSSKAEIERFNKACEAEHEALRMANFQRTRNGLPALRYNAEMSYVIRYLASQPGYAGHGNFPGNYNALYRQLFPKSRPITMVAENAWPEMFHGRTGREIGNSIQDGRFQAGDGHLGGWNHHPGHAQNVLSQGVSELGIGVYINPQTGAAEAYEVFIQ